MKLLEALVESNFKIYTNYECNYELILQILSYYNVIAETLLKIKIYNNINTHKHSNLMYTLNFSPQQMLLHPLKLFPTNVAASIEMENNGSFEMRTWYDAEKGANSIQKRVILAITSNCQNFYFLPQLTFLKVYFLIGHVVLIRILPQSRLIAHLE